MFRFRALATLHGVTITVPYAQGYRLDILDNATRAELPASNR